MSPVMMMLRLRLSVMMSAIPASDNHHVSELIDVSVVGVMIDVDDAGVPMMIVSSNVVILATMTARLHSPASQHERSDCQGEGDRRCRFV